MKGRGSYDPSAADELLITIKYRSLSRRYAFFRKHPRLMAACRNWFSETSGRVLVFGKKKTT